MQLVNEWYYFENELSSDVCGMLLDLSDEEWGAGVVDNSKREVGFTDEERKKGTKRNWEKKKDLRTSDIKWISDQDKIVIVMNIITPFMINANEKAGWNFDINEMQNPQVTRYQEGRFYTWHRDGGSDHLFNSSNWGRKLSMTVCLNDDYEGGELQMCSYGRTEHTVEAPPQGKGTIIVFPSFMDHQVAPVTKGVRYSLVTWFTGPPFK